VHEAWRQRIAHASGLRIPGEEKRRGRAPLAGIERMCRHAARLVEHDEVLVCVDDGHAKVGLGSGTCRQVRHGDDRARRDARALRGAAAVDAHQALGDERVHHASREPGKRRARDCVEPAGGCHRDGALGATRVHEIWRARSASAARFSRTSSYTRREKRSDMCPGPRTSMLKAPGQ